MLIDEIDVSKLSPMMKLYVETRREYADCILFYRLGDFYEMFFDDAILVSRELEITLTGKDCGLEERAPMCGVPYHAVDNYLNRLVANGHKVAICEQVEDPKLAKGLVKREVIRIATPGTILDTAALDASRNNYLMSIVCVADRFGIATVDISTGDFLVELSGIDLEEIKETTGAAIFILDPDYFDDEACSRILSGHFKGKTAQELGLADMNCGMIACGAVLRYLAETQKTDLGNLTSLSPYTIGKFMVLDSFTRRNLELTETLREKQRKGSLLWVLDRTKTAMGARLLRSFLEQPLIEADEIERRLEAVSEMTRNAITREEIREYLQPVYDLDLS